MSWQRFIAIHGAGMPATYLAAIVHQPVEDVRRVRNTHAKATNSPTRVMSAPRFVDLFSQWNGRAPDATDWPAPAAAGQNYQWLPPEDELLASLVGRVEKVQIARILTARLQKVTGDGKAVRTPSTVQQRVNRIGLQVTDVVGAIGIQEAGLEIGSVEIVRNAIRSKSLPSRLFGHRIVISRDDWAAWKASRTIAPPGWVSLASLRVPLGISSDSKLPEFAAAGYVPTAIRCNPAKPGVHNGKFGTWYIDPKVARKLIRDRHAGRPMPWHGKPMRDNMKATYGRWMQRKHPESCETCKAIWGAAGAPRTFEEYCARYGSITFGAKRHLTRKWVEGLTASAVARQAKTTAQHVLNAIAHGALRATKKGRQITITRTDATRWIARNRPSGTTRGSWVSFAKAKAWYGFTAPELSAFEREGRLQTRLVSRRRKYCRQQLSDLRQAIGYTEKQVAKLLHVTLPTCRELLTGVHWRQKGLIPYVTVQAARKRLEARRGYTVAQAAAEVKKPERWVRDRIQDGTVRVTRSYGDARQLWISHPMLERLRTAARRRGANKRDLSEAWIGQYDAARLAGVSTGTIQRWRVDSEVRTKPATHGVGVRYARVSIMKRARQYWRSPRLKRPQPPEWLQAEIRIGSAK